MSKRRGRQTELQAEEAFSEGQGRRGRGRSGKSDARASVSVGRGQREP